MKRIYLFFITFIIVNISFSQIKVVPIEDDSFKTNKTPLFYYLPKVIIDIDITIETNTFLPGPYGQYAEKYLSIKDAELQEYSFSKICDINLKKITVPDSECAFIIAGKKISLQYDNNGIIKSFGTLESKKDNSLSTIERLNIKEDTNKQNYYTDLSMQNNFVERTDTSYRISIVDSIITKVPVYKKQLTNKNTEEKAKEVANIILKIRENKFNLMSGQFETEVPPSDITSLISELEKLEQRYLELFTGKTLRYENNYNYKYTPKNNKHKEKVNMLWLSEERGIEDSEKLDNNPITFEITNMQTNKNLTNYYNNINKENNKPKGLYYRIPDYGKIKIRYKDHTYYQANTIIPQFGSLNYISNEMLNNKNTKIIFNVNTGFIEAISTE